MVHYAYVKRIWRKKGIGRFLAEAAGVLDAGGVAYTFESSAAPYLARKLERCEYVPIEEYLEPPSNSSRSKNA